MARINDEITNVAFESLSADPAAPTGNAPRFYWNNLSKKLRVYDGTQWIDAGGSGAGLGEVNYVVNPSASSNINGWVASGAGITVARTVTGSELPRETLTTSGIKITPVSGTTDYVRYRFQVGDADKGKKMKIQWAQKALSGYAAGDLVLEMFTNSASNYGGSYTQLNVQTSSVPLGDFVLLTTFDTTTADYYELRIRRAAGTTAIVLSDVVVGPGSLASVPAIASMIPFIGSGSQTTNTTYEASYTRIGRTALINYKLTFSGTPNGGPITLNPPPGLTYDTSADGFDFSQTDRTIMGSAGAVANASNVTPIYALWNGTTVKLSFKGTFTGSGLTADVEEGNPFAFVSGDTVVISYQAPIAEWQDTVFSTQTDVEYVFNTDSSDASDTTSFGYGIGGAQFGNFTAARTKRVRFRTPIQPTDRIVLQVSYDTGVTWTDIAGSGNIDASTSQNSVSYGAGIIAVNSTDLDVSFGQYRRADGATFGAAGSSWDDIDNLPGNVWRVVKSSNPLAIGHDLVGQNKSGLVASAGQLRATSTNDTAASGNVGESEIETYTGFAVTNSQYADGNSVTLAPGHWVITHQADWDVNGSSISGGVLLGIGISSNAGNDSTGLVPGETFLRYGDSGSTLTHWSNKVELEVNLATTTTYYAKVFNDGIVSPGAVFAGKITARRPR